ncbi:MAG: hypothetical protein QOH37_2379 [Nocardioidaceae bacterium]|jgi:hypothetical protein|nr:hypothetical protein [Nocardioidaceae bacterium]
MAMDPTQGSRYVLRTNAPGLIGPEAHTGKTRG